MKFYLGGPINGCTDEEAKGWREAVKPIIEAAGHTWLDPMSRDYRGVEDSAYVEIVEGDKEDINNSDILLMSCPKPSYGTAMEILYGRDNGKRVVAVLPNDAVVSPWVRYHAEVHTGSVVDVVAELVNNAWIAAQTTTGRLISK